jgi:hypothetical protein
MNFVHSDWMKGFMGKEKGWGKEIDSPGKKLNTKQFS